MSDDKYHTFLTTPWWTMGQVMEGECSQRINETATRGRAGILNVISGVTIVILIFMPELDPVIYVGPFVIYDMLIAAAFGLTPLSPAGLLGTFITMRTRPIWVPTAPKRFAWILGATLGILCLWFRLMHWPDSWIIAVAGTCFILTWLEGHLGFCLGCWTHALLFGCEVCETK